MYQQLGGENGIEKAIDLLYAKVLDDERLARFFNGVEIVLQRRKFRLFLNTVTGGPRQRSPIELRAAHANAVREGLSEEHFDAFIEHLEASLRELEVPFDTISRIVEVVVQTRSDVLGY